MLDQMFCCLRTRQLDVDLMHRQLHVAIFDLVSIHNRLERINEFASVVPLHVRSAEHHSRLLCTGRLRVYASSLEVLTFWLQRGHHACLVAQAKLDVVGDEWACRYAHLRILQKRRAHTALSLLRCFV